MTRPAPTPREEVLATGGIGQAGAVLLYRLVGIVAIARNFPPPEGFDRWNESAVTEMAHDFLDGERGQRRVVSVALSSVDDQSFERILERAVVNHLREVSRRTDMGKLIVRVAEILKEEAAFSRVEGAGDAASRWRLKDGPTAASSIPDTTLISALASLEITVPKWSSDSRAAPLADRESFVRMIVAALAAASGSLTAADIAQVIATRLDHRKAPLSIELDVLESAAEHPPALDPAVQASSAVLAEQIFRRLSERERMILALYDLPVRDLGDALALGRSQAALLRNRLAERLRDQFGPNATYEEEETVSELCRLCENWLEDRTRIPGVTFKPDDSGTAVEEGRVNDERLRSPQHTRTRGSARRPDGG